MKRYNLLLISLLLIFSSISMISASSVIHKSGEILNSSIVIDNNKTQVILKCDTIKETNDEHNIFRELTSPSGAITTINTPEYTARNKDISESGEYTYICEYNNNVTESISIKFSIHFDGENNIQIEDKKPNYVLITVLSLIGILGIICIIIVINRIK